MSHKIKFHTFNTLFQLFAYLADRTGGWRMFVHPKLPMGLLLTCFTLFGNMSLNAQIVPIIYHTDVILNKKFEADHIFDVVEQMPKLPGGHSALFEFIEKNLIIPTNSTCNLKTQGGVYCSLIIEKDGSVSKIKVLRSLDICRDKEAIRVLKLLPRFIPGKHNGKVVRVYYTLRVNFKR